MELVLGPGRDPALKHIFLLRGERLVDRGRRHDLLGVDRIDAGDQLAFLRVARRDGSRFDGSLAAVEPQIGLARGTIGAVAREAVLGQDRPDVAVVFQFPSGQGIPPQQHRKMNARARARDAFMTGSPLLQSVVGPPSSRVSFTEFMKAPPGHGPEQQAGPAGNVRAGREGHGTSRPFPKRCAWPWPAPAGPVVPQECLDDGKVLERLGGQAMVIVARCRVVPGRVAKRPKQVLQAAELVDKERIPTPAGDQIVQHGYRAARASVITPC